MAKLHLHLLLAVLVAASNAAAAFRAEMRHPYAGSSLSVHAMLVRSARASKARVARLHGRVAGDMSVPLAHISDEGYTVTVGIGTPPQPRTLIVDTGSDLTWTQCKNFNGTTWQQEPLFDPAKSSSFTLVTCTSKLCMEDNLGAKICSNKTCRYHYPYISVEAVGELAYEAFDFSDNEQRVSLTFGFGCGALIDGSLLGASGIMGLAPTVLSMVSQLAIAKFSYCLTPYADRKNSPLFFGAWADLRRYKTTGPIQTVPLLRNPVSSPTFYYYVPLVGLSLGTRLLDVPASTFALENGGTVVDSGSTVGTLMEPAFTALKEALHDTLDLPLTNRTVKDYKVCFALPRGVAMGAVQAPTLTLHFDGGADMKLPKDNYFQEPRAGLMCLAMVAAGVGGSVIGNVQQQNFHVLFDVQHGRFLFAPTSCDDI